MKSRLRNIILISIACVLLVVIILCSTVFTIKNISVNFLDNNHTMSEAEVLAQIENSGSINKGQSVFIFNKSKATKTLEKNIPYIRVINLEAICPDTIRVNCVERKDCYAIKVNSASYLVVDKYYKVLKVVNATALPIINLSSDTEVGSVIENADVKYFNGLTNAFDAIATYENAICKLFASVELVNVNDRLDFVLKTREGGITFNVQNVNELLNEKVNKMVGVLGTCSSGATVNIYVSNNEVIAEENA